MVLKLQDVMAAIQYNIPIVRQISKDINYESEADSLIDKVAEISS